MTFLWRIHICPDTRVLLCSQVDISRLSAEQLAAYNADLWLLSPACQPYTVLNPNAKGAADPRAKSFLYLVQQVLPKLKEINALPGRLLVENVAGFEVFCPSLFRPRHHNLKPAC